MAESPWHSPIVELVHRAFRGDLSIEEIMALTPAQQHNLVALIRYEVERRARRCDVWSPANRRARTLLASFLTEDQRRSLRNQRYFQVCGSAGGMYRICTVTGVVQRVELHGKRWYWAATLCLHDYAADAPDAKRLPLADLALQQMLLLRADEPAFLALANVAISSSRMWDSQWLRELRRAHAERDAAERRERPREPFVYTLDLGTDDSAADWRSTEEEARAVA